MAVVGAPSAAHRRAALTSKAVADSVPVNCGVRSSKVPSRIAVSRTEYSSGRQRFQAEGGDCVSVRARRISSAASPCQMQLNHPLARAIGSPA